MNRQTVRVSLLALGLALGLYGNIFAETFHSWEKVEITLKAERSYSNPYKEVVVWVDLKGPDFDKRCYGFWDGGNTFRVRVVATSPGNWTWKSGSDQSDPGLNGKTGGFTATAWTEAEKRLNICRRGFIRPTANGHAFEHADGTPFFLVGDTWWSVPTFRYRWYDDDEPRPIGPAMGLKDAVRYRKVQGYNCIAMIAAHPAWASDGRPTRLKTEDGTVIRSAWGQAGTNSAKDMHDEDGNRPFLFPGRVPGFESIVADLDRINPAYFQSLDKKIDYLNAQGFIPFIEPARRDIGQVWKKYHDWPDSYTRYIQYVWSRYQANNCLFSPIHLDSTGMTISPEDWNEAANKVIETYGSPPFGTLVSCNSSGSSLRNFGHVDKAKWITFHQIGNGRREHMSYGLLTEIFNTKPPIPAINGEPYYDGWGRNAAPGGSEQSALFARSAMYGSVLSGGSGGHIHGAAGLWPGNVEPAAEHKIWEAIKWPAGAQMQHLRTFVMSEGRQYQDLVPHRDLVSPNESGGEMGWVGWSYCARTEAKDFFLLYFEKDCPRAIVSGAVPSATYAARWFNPRSGGCTSAGGFDMLVADESGRIALTEFPDGEGTSAIDWGLRLKRLEPLSGDAEESLLPLSPGVQEKPNQ